MKNAHSLIVLLCALIGIVLTLSACKSDAEREAERERDWLVSRKYITAYEPLGGFGDNSEAARRAESREAQRARERGVDTRVHLILEMKNGTRIEWASASPGKDSSCWTGVAQGTILPAKCRSLAGMKRVIEPGEGPP